MDLPSIASVATDMSNARVQQTQEVTVLKKAIDIEASGALQLVAAIAPGPTLSSSGGEAGQVINVKA